MYRGNAMEVSIKNADIALLALRAVLSTSSAVVLWAVIVSADTAIVSSVRIRFIVLVELVRVLLFRVVYHRLLVAVVHGGLLL